MNESMRSTLDRMRAGPQKVISAFKAEIASTNQDSDSGWGITSILRWKAEPVMAAEIMLAELNGVVSLWETEVDNFDGVTDNTNVDYRLASISFIEDSIEYWTRRVMQQTGSRSICPITNLVEDITVDVFRKLIKDFSFEVRQLKALKFVN